jgi:hypothetical protein
MRDKAPVAHGLNHVSCRMANEPARLQITLLTNAELVRFPYSLLSLFDFLRARIRPTAFNVAAMPHKVAMVHPN